MTLLFDISDDTPVRKPVRARAKAVPPPAEITEVKKQPLYIGEIGYLGKLDDRYQCIDQTCQCSVHDIADEFDGHWTIECFVCGTGQTVPVIRGFLEPRQEEFRFRDGRHEGKTIAEAYEDRRGRDYVTWAAAEHPRKAVREACQKFLDSQSAAV